MSRLVRLYPAAWRERYEAEFIGTLQERSVRTASSVDIIRGAIDAHLHPELFGGAPHPWTHRLPGLLATAAGLLWTWYFLRIALAAPDDWGNGIFIAMLLMLVAVLGDHLTAYPRQIVVIALSFVAAAALAGAEPLAAIGDGLLAFALGATAALLLACGVLTLAALRAGIGVGARWALILGAVLIPVAVGIFGMGGFGPSDPGGVLAMAVAIAPYGIAWATIGLRMALRGSATIHDAPSSPQVPEVYAT